MKTGHSIHNGLYFVKQLCYFSWLTSPIPKDQQNITIYPVESKSRQLYVFHRDGAHVVDHKCTEKIQLTLNPNPFDFKTTLIDVLDHVANTDLEYLKQSNTRGTIIHGSNFQHQELFPYINLPKVFEQYTRCYVACHPNLDPDTAYLICRYSHDSTIYVRPDGYWAATFSENSVLKFKRNEL